MPARRESLGCALSGANLFLAMALDTWSHLLDPGQVFKQFSELFISFSEKWAPELELSSEMLDANYGRQMKTFAQSLELLDEPVLHNIQIIECVKPLGELIGRLKGTARSSLKLVTTDVLVCAALVPSLIIPAPRTCHISEHFQF